MSAFEMPENSCSLVETFGDYHFIQERCTYHEINTSSFFAYNDIISTFS